MELKEESGAEKAQVEEKNRKENNIAENKPVSYISVAEKLKLFRPGKIQTVEHYPTGIRQLDERLGGGLYSGLIFLGARPGMGKSTLALQIASEVAAGGTPVLFYSLEMPAIRIESKILNRAIHMQDPEAKITSDWLLREENVDKKEEWELVEKVQKKMGSRYEKLYIKERDKISFSAEDIVADVEKFMEETGSKPVVFVDYLQILSACASTRGTADKQRNDENINVLSSLSNKYDMAVFVISSLNRESYRNAQKSIQLDSFKETGGIEYSASVILGLQLRNIEIIGAMHESAMSSPVRKLELVFLKQRYGMTGTGANVALDFYPAKDLYLEYRAEESSRVKAETMTKAETSVGAEMPARAEKQAEEEEISTEADKNPLIAPRKKKSEGIKLKRKRTEKNTKSAHSVKKSDINNSEKPEPQQNEFVPEDEYSKALFEKFMSMPDDHDND